MCALKREDYDDHGCCFGRGGVIPAPDTAPAPAAIDVPAVVRTLDALLERDDLGAARAHLERWLTEARALGDWRGELSVQSELMGLHRRTGDSAAALSAVEGGLALINAHHLGSTVSGATVTLNAATTLKALGRAARSLPLFEEVCRVYAASLDPGDYRFAGLYNNMALSLADTGDLEGAETCFRRAMAVIRACPNPENELAVTDCNLAELYERADPEDPRIGGALEDAWACLNAPGVPQDGYHAFTLSKCAPTFGHFGYFFYETALKKRAKELYDRT